MRTAIFSVLMLGLPALAAAQQSPTGRWKTIDDATGRVMTITEVYQATNGTLAARIVQVIDPSAAVCAKCTGGRKGRSTVGMDVLWNLRPIQAGWGGGEGVKPSTGDEFRVESVRLIDGGNRLEVTGCRLVFCRTAYWQRIR